MAELKNIYTGAQQQSQKDNINIKENPVDQTQGSSQTCSQSMKRKLGSCTDVLANYFECLRVFSEQKLQELRRKALQQQKQSQSLQKQTQSEASVIINQKFEEIDMKQNLKNYTRKQKALLVYDYDELPVNNYATDQKLKFTKKYAQTYDKSYSERRKKFGYTFQQVERQRKKQQEKKQKNCWQQFKRLICCRGGNYIQQIQQKETDAEIQSSLNQSILGNKREPSLANSKKSVPRQNNIFLFQQQNDIKQQPQQIVLTKHNRRSHAKLNNNQSGYQNSSRKSQNLQIRNTSQDHTNARKISSRLGVDTQLLIKRKQYQQKTNNQYNQNDGTYDNTYGNNGNGQNNMQYIDSRNNQKSNNNTATNSYRTGQQQNNNKNNYIFDNIDNNNEYNNNTYDNNGQYNDDGMGYNTGQSSLMRRNDRNNQTGVAKVKVDKKAKISKMFKQVQNQNDQQFNPDLVIFNSNDVHKNSQLSNNNEYSQNNNDQHNIYNNNNNQYNNSFHNNNKQKDSYNNSTNNQQNGYSNNNNNNQDYNNYQDNNYKKNNTYNNNTNDNNDYNMNNNDNNDRQNMNTSHISNSSDLSNMNYQRVKKTKNKKAKHTELNTSNIGDNQQNQSFNNIQQSQVNNYINNAYQNQDNTFNNNNNNRYDNYQNNPSTSGRNKTNKNHHSALLIVKQNNDLDNDYGNDIPSNSLSFVKGQNSVFKKKKKDKKNIVLQHQQPNNDDIIIIEEQNNNNSFGYNNNNNVYNNEGGYNNNDNGYNNEGRYNGYGEYNNDINEQIQQIKEIPQQMMKKKKNKRKNLIVEHQNNNDQEIADLDNL